MEGDDDPIPLLCILCTDENNLLPLWEVENKCRAIKYTRVVESW